jgi:hypothetical protein
LHRTLDAHATVEIAATPKLLSRALPRADAVLSLLTDRIDEAVLVKAPRLRVVGNYAAGVNNIDLAACARRGIRVVNTPDVLSRATAELTVALLFSVAKRLPEGDAICRADRFTGWASDYLLGLELAGRNAVLVGEYVSAELDGTVAEYSSRTVKRPQPQPEDFLASGFEMLDPPVPSSPTMMAWRCCRRPPVWRRCAMPTWPSIGRSPVAVAM